MSPSIGAPGTAWSCRRATRSPSSRSRPGTVDRAARRRRAPQLLGRLGGAGPDVRVADEPKRPAEHGALPVAELGQREGLAQLVEPGDLAGRERDRARQRVGRLGSRRGLRGQKLEVVRALRMVEAEAEQPRDRLRAEASTSARGRRRGAAILIRRAAGRSPSAPTSWASSSLIVTSLVGSAGVGGRLSPRGERVRELAARQRIGRPEAAGSLPRIPTAVTVRICGCGPGVGGRGRRRRRRRGRRGGLHRLGAHLPQRARRAGSR